MKEKSVKLCPNPLKLAVKMFTLMAVRGLETQNIFVIL